MRERKKRGRVLRKDIAATAAVAANRIAPLSGEWIYRSPQSQSDSALQDQEETSLKAGFSEDRRPLSNLHPPSFPLPDESASTAMARGMNCAAMYLVSRTMSISAVDFFPENQISESTHHPTQPQRIQTQHPQMYNHSVLENATADEFNRDHQQSYQTFHLIVPTSMCEYTHIPYEMMSPQSARAFPHSFRVPDTESSIPSHIATLPVSDSPDWLPLLSHSTKTCHINSHLPSSQELRYPVLTPLAPPYLTNIT
jgi:hypothetical protein